MPSVRRRQAAEKVAEAEEEVDKWGWPDLSKDIRPNELRSNHWTVIFIIFLGLLIVSSRLHICLPTPLPPNEDDTQFSEIRAKPILMELSNYGPKPAGSYACEELTRNRILQELQTISSKALPSVQFELATQNPSSCFDVPKFDVDAFTVCYKNVSNVIARIGRSDGVERTAVLLNCHYDSWPISSGGSDDLISCALMLELARLLSHQPEKLSHDVVLLFNGAEESSLLAAHGFITQHPWRHSIRAFINLEASGSGGRELLFQAGPANQWLLNSYLEAAVHPHCSILGQEIFETGKYPGDTDFKVFRDYGKIPGLDLAFVQNGYWWHTEFDEAERITDGSLQRAGENVYSTLCHLLQSPYLDQPAQYGDRKTVFFDFLGLFVVVYPLSVAHTISIILILATFIQIAKYLLLDGFNSPLLRASFHYFIVVFFMILCTIIMVKMTIFMCGHMMWYSRHFISLFLYGIPVLWTGTSVQSFLANKLPRNERAKHASAIELVHCFVLALLLFWLTKSNIASGFLVALLLLPIIKFYIPTYDDAWYHSIIHLLLALPGLSMIVYTSEMLISIFIPIMGRTSGNPEPIIATFVALSAILIGLSLTGLISRSAPSRAPSDSGIRDFLYMLGGVFFFILIILTGISLFNSSPYNYDHKYPTAKRIQIFHVNRLFYDRDNTISIDEGGLYVISHDHRGAEDIPFVKEDPEFKPIVCHTDFHLCDIPFYYPTKDRVQERHVRYRTVKDRPKLSRKTTIDLLSKQNREDTIDYQFRIKGSNQISTYVTAEPGWMIISQSLSKEPTDHNRLFLFLTCNGFECGEWNFNITMKRDASTDKPLSSSSPSILIGIASHYLHGDYMQSPMLKSIVSNIEENRKLSNEWTITASAWNVDHLYRYF